MKKVNMMILSCYLSFSMSYIGIGAETAEQLAQSCYFNSWSVSCCFISLCHQNTWYGKQKPRIVGYKPTLLDFSGDKLCQEQVSSDVYDSPEDCEFTFSKLPNKCALNTADSKSATQTSLEVIPDSRSELSLVEKNILLSDLDNAISSGDFEAAHQLVREIPLTHAEYTAHFSGPMDKKGESLTDPIYNRGGFIFDREFSDYLNHLDHAICSVKKKDLAKILGYFEAK